MPSERKETFLLSFFFVSENSDRFISAELTVIVNTQVPSVHLHHEHSLNSRDRRHHQLELQGTTHALHAELDEGRLFEVN